MAPYKSALVRPPGLPGRATSTCSRATPATSSSLAISRQMRELHHLILLWISPFHFCHCQVLGALGGVDARRGPRL